MPASSCADSSAAVCTAMRAASLGSSYEVPRQEKDSVPAASEACCSAASAASLPCSWAAVRLSRWLHTLDAGTGMHETFRE